MKKFIFFAIIILLCFIFQSCSNVSIRLKQLNDCPESIISKHMPIETKIAIGLTNLKILKKYPDKKEGVKKTLNRMKEVLNNKLITFEDFSSVVKYSIMESNEYNYEFIIIKDLLSDPEMSINAGIPECDKEYIISLIVNMVFDIDNI